MCQLGSFTKLSDSGILLHLNLPLIRCLRRQINAGRPQRAMRALQDNVISKQHKSDGTYLEEKHELAWLWVITEQAPRLTEGWGVSSQPLH